MKKIISRSYKYKKLSQIANMPMYGDMGNDLDLFYDTALGERDSWTVIDVKEGHNSSDLQQIDKWDSETETHYTEPANTINTMLDFAVVYQQDIYYSDSLQRLYGPLNTAFENLLKQTPESMSEEIKMESELQARLSSMSLVDSNVKYNPKVIDITPVRSNWYRVTFAIAVDIDYTEEVGDY